MQGMSGKTLFMQGTSGNGGTKPAVKYRLTSGYPRDEKRSSFLAADQWADAFLSLYFLLMQCTCGDSRIQNPDTPRAGRGGAAYGGAAGRNGAGQDRMPTGRFAQETAVRRPFQSIVDKCLACLFGSTNTRNPM